MLKDSQCGLYGDHPCNIGGQIAYDLASKYQIPALTVDPPVCNEMRPEATIFWPSGDPEDCVLSGAESQGNRRRYCQDHHIAYTKDVNLIVAHMGGGITVAAHEKGKITDVNNGLAGDGPFALERSGDLPDQQTYQTVL